MANQRRFQQPYTTYRIRTPSLPRQVFYPPFEIRVDPRSWIEQLRGDTNQYRSDSAAVARFVTMATVEELRHSSADLNRARPSRLCPRMIQWRFYYTQSEGLPPTVRDAPLPPG